MAKLEKPVLAEDSLYRFKEVAEGAAIFVQEKLHSPGFENVSFFTLILSTLFYLFWSSFFFFRYELKDSIAKMS